MHCSVASLPAFDERYRRKARLRLYTALSTNISSFTTSLSPAFSICSQRVQPQYALLLLR